MSQIYVVIFIFRPIDKLESYKRREISSTTHDPFHLIANLLIKGVVVGMIGVGVIILKGKTTHHFLRMFAKVFPGM